MFRDIPIEQQRALQREHVEEIERMSTSDRLRMMAETGAQIHARFGGSSHFEKWVALLVRTGLADPDQFATDNDFREQMHTVHLTSRWAEFGFNVFDLSNDLAAGFVLTEPPPTPEKGLSLPFPTFCIRIPEGIVPVFSFGKQLWADCLWVHTYEGKHITEGHTNFFRYIASRKALMVWRDRFPGNLDAAEDEGFFNNTIVGDPPIQEEDALTASATLRVIKNLVAWLDAVGGLATQAKPEPPRLKRKASKESRQRASSGAWPHVWFFGKQVKLSNELRKMAAEVSLGGSKDHAVQGWKVRVRHIVRGHWKNQPHGEDRALRKRLWVQPYWRGPEGAAAWAHLYK